MSYRLNQMNEVHELMGQVASIVKSIYKKSIRLTEDIDSDEINIYAKRKNIAVDNLRSKLHQALNNQIKLVEKMDDERQHFLQLSSYDDYTIEKSRYIPIFQQIWFGDYFESEGIDALYALQEYLKTVLDELTLTHLVRKIA